jgi:uncharacterized protein with HEPN domain
MSKRSAELLLEDILESIQKIQKFTKGMSFDKFINDDKTVDAVIRNFEIIGEASNRLSEEFKEKHEEIDWSRIKGFRNRIVHDYFGIDHSIVWKITKGYIPELTKAVQRIIKGRHER